MQNRESTYVVQADRLISSDTVYYQIDKSDLKILYEQAFGEMMNKQSAKDHLTLFITYVPLTLIFVLLITLVNIRWNRAYKRLKNKESEVVLDEEDKKNIKKLDLRFYSISDRLFFYIIIWISSAIFDSIMLLNNILQIPFAAIFSSLFILYEIITRLVEGSTLMGINDTDLIKNYSKYIKGMLRDKLEKLFNKD